MVDCGNLSMAAQVSDALMNILDSLHCVPESADGVTQPHFWITMMVSQAGTGSTVVEALGQYD